MNKTNPAAVRAGMLIRFSTAAAALALTSCIPIHQMPPPGFTPRPPYPPEPVIPGQTQAAPPQTPNHRSPNPPIQAYPLAQKTTAPNEVISPYPPHHRIDITGFSPDQLARDPYNQKIFRIP